MYWPVGTPSIFATSSSSAPDFNLVVSDDGQPNHFGNPTPGGVSPESPFLEAPPRGFPHQDAEPTSPMTPATPAVKSVEKEDMGLHLAGVPPASPRPPAKVPLKDPILALRMSRNGHIFAVITATSMTIWQAKVSRDPRLDHAREVLTRR